jgi:hypothetical protein
MHVESFSLKTGQTIGGCEQLVTESVQILQSLVGAQIFDLIDGDPGSPTPLITHGDWSRAMTPAGVHRA